jgi:hypothetical protein
MHQLFNYSNMKKITLATLFFCLWTGAYSQVTIGGAELPKAGAILDLNSTHKGGLVLSNVTITDLEKIPYSVENSLFPGITTPAAADVNTALRGAMVYNDGKNGTTVPAGIYVWNGSCWTKDGSSTAAAITAYSPASKSGVISGSGSVALSVTPNGSPADFGYKWKNGSGVTVGTNQSYPATAMGTYSWTVTPRGGAPVTSDNFTVAVLPDDSHIGTGTFDGKVCFDIAESNFNTECGSQAERAADKADFTTLGAVPYTFTAATTGVGNVRYVILDEEGCVDPPLSGILEAGTLANGSSVTLNVNYKTTLNSDNNIIGRTKSGAALVTIYIIYNNSSEDVKVSRKVRIQDSKCCPGYLAVGGEYVQGPGNMTSAVDNKDFNFLITTSEAWKFGSAGYDLCFYKTDGTGVSSWANAKSACAGTGTTYNDGTGGWRLPNVAELGAIGSIYDKLNEKSTSASGTNSLAKTSYFSSTEFPTDRSVWWTFNSPGPGYTTYGYPPGSLNVRCVKRWD